MTTPVSSIPLPDFVDRVLTTRERVQFSFADPYGHLNSAKYLELLLNHRLHAADEQLACFAVDIAKVMGVGFATTDVALRFLSPCKVGDWVELASWVTSHDEASFTIKAVMIGEPSRRVKAVATARFASISLTTGAPCPMPAALPTRLAPTVIEDRPRRDTYVATLKGAEGAGL